MQGVTADMESYNPTDAARRIEAFVDVLSTWYVRRSRRRFWKSTDDAEKEAAHHTLYTCLVTLARLLAPFTPFLAEELYGNLVRSVDPSAPDSVHLAAWPEADAVTDRPGPLAVHAPGHAPGQHGSGGAEQGGYPRAAAPWRPSGSRFGAPTRRRAVEGLRDQLLDELNVEGDRRSQAGMRPSRGSGTGS